MFLVLDAGDSHDGVVGQGNFGNPKFFLKGGWQG